jgi:hypothetical protein
VTLSYPVPADGFRLMALTGSSNAPVPVRDHPIHVVQRSGADVLSEVDLVTDADGVANIALEAGAVSLEIIDRFGNSVTVTL